MPLLAVTPSQNHKMKVLPLAGHWAAQELATWYESTAGKIQNLVLGLTALVSMGLFFDSGIPDVVMGVATVIAGMLKSWSLYARYDLLEQRHRDASRTFADITTECKAIIGSICEVEDESFVSA